jgi:hypothetical protein
MFRVRYSATLAIGVPGQGMPGLATNDFWNPGCMGNCQRP